MECGVPFCQSHTGCPLGNIIPRWNDLVFQVKDSTTLVTCKMVRLQVQDHTLVNLRKQDLSCLVIDIFVVIPLSNLDLDSEEITSLQ